MHAVLAQNHSVVSKLKEAQGMLKAMPILAASARFLACYYHDSLRNVKRRERRCVNYAPTISNFSKMAALEPDPWMHDAKIWCAKNHPSGGQPIVSAVLVQMHSDPTFKDGVFAYSASLNKVEAGGHVRSFELNKANIVKAIVNNPNIKINKSDLNQRSKLELAIRLVGAEMAVVTFCRRPPT